MWVEDCGRSGVREECAQKAKVFRTLPQAHTATPHLISGLDFTILRKRKYTYIFKPDISAAATAVPAIVAGP